MNIIKYPLTTEKAVRIMESENKLTFVVDNRAKKAEIKDAVEKTFKVKVLQVNTLVSSKGRKKAIVLLSQENPAMDVITELGLM